MFQQAVALLPLLLYLSSHQQADGFLTSSSSLSSSRLFGVVARRIIIDIDPSATTFFNPSTRLYAVGGGDGNPAESSTSTTSTATAAPVLNGKRVLPYKVLMAGLKGHPNVAGVFVLMNSEYKRGEAGWEQCEHIGVSFDLEADMTQLVEDFGSEKVAHVRAMSFIIPSEGAMQSIADDWRIEVAKAGGRINFDPVLAAMEMPFEGDDDDLDYDDMDEDDMEFLEMTAEAMSMATGGGAPPAAAVAAEEVEGIVSPFEMPQAASVTTTAEEKKIFNKENVDQVLDEVRPYLISDGGNVSVERVDEETRNVYLILEGACGSCPSSTVTMQMGIERVLKENFENLGEVLRVEDDGDGLPKELSFEMVAVEINRINPAIIAMGGSVEIVSVDGESGIVELKFNGAAKVRQGLELAIQDIDFVKEVKFME
jgi:Fe-S cluster biogenesis protein NfuA